MIANATRLVTGGGVIVYPTETVYGLGANALDEQAILRVFQIKRRPHNMPISLAVSSMEREFFRDQFRFLFAKKTSFLTSSPLALQWWA